MTLGLPCIIDNTTYTDLGPNGQQFTSVVTRDNCRTPELYCDENTTTCQHTKAIGLTCLADQQCQSVSLLDYSFHHSDSKYICSITAVPKASVRNPPRLPSK